MSWLKWPLVLALAAAFLFLILNIYAAGHPVWAVCVLALVSAGFFIYLTEVAFAYRYLFPGLAGMALFVAFPLLYTIQIGFTNYSSNNLLSQERARDYLLEQTLPDESKSLGYTLHPDGDEFRLVLTPLHEDEDERDPAKLAALQASSLVSTRLALRSAQPPEETEMLPLAQASFHINEPLSLKELLKHRDVLMHLKLKLPDGRRLSYTGVREFGPLNPIWKQNPDGSLTQVETGERFHPNMDSGFFEGADGARLQPGFKVNIGLGNYTRMFSDPDFRGPFLAIFGWTVVFASLTVLFSLTIGMTLAVLLN